MVVTATLPVADYPLGTWVLDNALHDVGKIKGLGHELIFA
jgi:hypothetical protein